MPQHIVSFPRLFTRCTSAFFPHPHSHRLSAVLVAALLLFCVPADAALVVLSVDRTDDAIAGAMICDDLVPDDCSLRGALFLANAIAPADDVLIELGAEPYVLSVGGAAENANWSGDLDVMRDLTIQGQGKDSTLIVAWPGFDDRLIDIHAANTVTLVGLQVAVSQPAGDFHAVQARAGANLELTDVGFRSNGTFAGGGGGLYLDHGVVAVLEDCLFEGNKTGLNGGAGLRSHADSLTIRDSRFVLNQAQGSPGGALQLLAPVVGSSTNLLERVVIEHNSADLGGGIYGVKYTETTIIDSTLRNNIADDGVGGGSGGAIFSTGIFDIERSTLHANSAVALGPAVHAEYDGQPGARVNTYNVTISGHRSGGLAAVSFSSTDDSEFLHSTFYDNDLDFFGDSPFEIFVHNSVFGAGCVIVGYDAISSGGNLGVDDSCWSGTPAAGDTVVVDLQLAPLGSYGGLTQTHLPTSGSPAGGLPTVCAPVDQRDHLRPASGCYSGAVERLDPEPAIFADGFESGDTGHWAATVP